MAPRHCYRFKAPCLLFPWGRAHPRGAGVGDGRARCGGPPGTGARTPAPGPAVLPARGHPAGSSHACTLALPRRVLGGVSGGPWLGGREGGFPSHLRGGDHPLPSPPQGRAPRSGRAAWPAPRPAEAVQVGRPGSASPFSGTRVWLWGAVHSATTASSLEPAKGRQNSGHAPHLLSARCGVPSG